MTPVSVLIVNWNTQDILPGCLESLYSNTKIPFEVIIIDNNVLSYAPVEKQAFTPWKNIIQKYENLRIIQNGKNLGFAYAVNQGIKESKGEFVCTLNPDVNVTSGYIDALAAKLETNKKFGAVTGKLLRFSDKRMLDSTGQVIFSHRFARDRGHHKIDANQYPEGPVFGTCAAATLYRREMLQDIKIDDEYFDNDFFAYLEDVDLAWRARLRGWDFYFFDKAIAYHQRAATSKTVLKMLKRKYLGWRNRFLMIVKNDTLCNIIMNAPFFFLAPVKSVKMFRKRCVVQKRRFIKHREISKWFLPYFELKRRNIQK